MVRAASWFIECICVALVYVIFARVSQTLAIPPGNVSPVWIPSGVCFAWALVRGPAVWPGVLAGAMLGNVWAYFDPASFETAARAAGSALFNGIGDALAIAGAAALVRSLIGSTNLFASIHNVTVFMVVGVLLGAFVSALFGVTGLWIFGFVETASYSTVFATWFTGDAIGVLALAPVIILLATDRSVFRIGDRVIETVLLLAATGALGATVLLAPKDIVGYHVLLFTVPPVIVWMSVRVGLALTSIALPLISVVAIAGALTGNGPFATGPTNEALINVQLLIGTIGISALYLSSGAMQLHATLKTVSLARDVLEEQVRIRTAELQAEKDRAEKLASTDPLTGVANRRVFFERGECEISDAERHGRPVSVIMLDIDHFKQVNDTYGHDAGDEVLMDAANTIASILRDHDVFARIGGEEFAILLPETDLAGATRVADRIRCDLQNRLAGVDRIAYTASFGVSALDPETDTVAMALKRADKALYRAKGLGRNRIEQAAMPEVAAMACM